MKHIENKNKVSPHIRFNVLQSSHAIKIHTPPQTDGDQISS